MDDDDVQDTGVVAGDDVPGSGPGTEPKTTATPPPTAATVTPEAASDQAPPPKPPRPLTEAQKNEMILKEAFPSVDDTVIKAVLRASSGRVEPAFNALLGM